LVEAQFTKFYNSMPPLNRIGFVLDQWQKDTIYKIRQKESVILMCPTSSGKTILSSYVTTVSQRIIYLVPTEPLAYQVGSYLTKILNENIPIITTRTQLWKPEGVELDKLNTCKAIVGTPYVIETILPFIKCNFGYAVYDEIHCLDGNEGESLERVIKFLKNIPFLALSASIGNLTRLTEWWQQFTDKTINTIVYKGRFFNLQKGVFNDDLEFINPLSLVSIDSFKDKSVLNKSLEATPQDVWALYLELTAVFDLGDLDIYKYFSNIKLITLLDVDTYFKCLINFMTTQDQNKVDHLLSKMKKINVKTDIKLIDICLNLKDSDRTPTIIFQVNTVSCKKMAFELLDQLEDGETNKYPNYRKDLDKQYKLWERWNDKEGHKLDQYSDKQIKKLNETKKMDDIPIKPDINEPHEDFRLTKVSMINEEINSWMKIFKRQFKSSGQEPHPIIRMLRRGFGIYARGLPSNYLKLVQQLANQKVLAVVFSDMQLVYGVSMPFKSVVIYKDKNTKDTLDPLLNLQMSGRAGRRGLDKEGYVIYAGYDWDRIVELCTTPLPIIKGKNQLLPTIYSLDLLSNRSSYELVAYPFNNEKTNVFEFSKEIIDKWGKIIDFNNKLKVGLIWNMRKYEYNSLILLYLVPYLESLFHMKNNHVDNQLLMAHVLCHFIEQKQATNDKECLMIKYPEHLEKLSTLGIPIIKSNIDNKIYCCIQRNSISKIDSKGKEIDSWEIQELRNRIWNFGENIRNLQNYCHKEEKVLMFVLGKLFTRIWWIYYESRND
jgi:superfamily II DNA or RNA helicase